MFFLLLLIPFLLWMSIAWFLCSRDSSKNNYVDYTPGLILSSMFAVLILMIGVITMSVAYSDSVSWQEEIANQQRQKVIYTEKRDVLLKQQRTLLDTTYGSYEAQLYDKMFDNKANASTNVNVYPQPQFNTTLITLSTQITDLNNAIYACDSLISCYITKLRCQLKSIFVFKFILPDFNEDLLLKATKNN